MLSVPVESFFYNFVVFKRQLAQLADIARDNDSYRSGVWHYLALVIGGNDKRVSKCVKLLTPYNVGDMTS